MSGVAGPGIVQRAFWGHLLIATVTSAIALFISGNPVVSMAPILMGSLWFTAQRYGLRWTAGVFLFLFLTGIALAFWLNAPAWLLLAGGIATLGAWDLDCFSQRLGMTERRIEASQLIAGHLRRLGTIEGAALLAGLIAIFVRTRISFWWAALLSLITIVFVTRLLAAARKQAE